MSKIDRYAVIGNPIHHSISPRVHMAFAASTNQALQYDKILSSNESFESDVQEFFTCGGLGLNVTSPFKLKALELACITTSKAKFAGAANTLRLVDGVIEAANTDGSGLVTDIITNLDHGLKQSRILILGAGGAVRGILGPILEQEPSRIHIVDLELTNARSLLNLYATDCTLTCSTYEDLPDKDFDLVINATSASLLGVAPPITGRVFNNAELAYDLAYGTNESPFMHLAIEHGARQVVDGVGMLLEQAAESFFWWRGVRPDTASLIKLCRFQGLTGS